MDLSSKVTLAKAGTKSLRATVPQGVVAYLDLQEGDALNWDMEIDRNGKIVIVRKLTTIGKQRT